MKINRNPELINYIQNLIDNNDINVSIGEMFFSVLGKDKDLSVEEIETIIKKYNLKEEDFIMSLLLDMWEIDLKVDDNQTIYDLCIKDHIKLVDFDKYINNPYYKNIKIKDIKDGKYELKYDNYTPYELFPLDDIKVDDNFIEHSSLAFFKKEFPFIVLNEKDVTWMSITPNEINTMEKSIKEAKGNVLVFGLGLGYYPYMISLKDGVKSITIIEKDKHIIEIFNKYLFPQFENKDIIQIIEMDALEYNFDDDKYDYVFIDLWKTPDDGIDLFLTFKALEKNYKNTIFSYWLNNSFYAFIRRCFISLLAEQLNGLKDDSYKHEENSFDHLINHLYFKTKNLQIESINQLRDLLSDESLIKLAI